MQRNLFLFVVLAALVLGGWFLVITNTRTPKDQELTQEQKDKKEQGAKDRQAKAKAKAKEEKDRAKEKEEKDAKSKEKNPPVPVIAKDEGPTRTESLGGAGFHLSVDTTTRGAGVYKVVLNRFKAADWRGRPTDREFEIIQEDPISPSFRMYHYRDSKDEAPVFGLGEKNWTFEGRNQPDATTHEVRYSTTVPGLDHVKIVKTYRLAPQDYHVTMLLEIHDLRTEKDAPKIAFRYQLTGGQGVPVEGEFYTATFRNALMGLVDPRENLWRKLEESATVSLHKGGDRFPTGDRGEHRLQYAGVANQYFGVMIVVDNEQPKRDDGGTTPDKILAWARPTHESRERRGSIITIGDDRIVFRDNDSFTAIEKLDKIVHEQTKTRAETKEGVTEKLATTQKEIAKKTAQVKAMGLPHADKVDTALTRAVDAMKQAAKHIEAGQALEAIAEQDQAIEDLKKVREALTGPVRYTLLPRTKSHLRDLNLEPGDRAVLGFYDAPDGGPIATWVRLGDTLKPQFDDITVRVNSEVIDLHPREIVKHQFLLYHGPVKAALLAQFIGEKAVPADTVDRYTHTLHLRTLTDYHSDNWFGKASSFIRLTDLIILFTRLMHWLLNLLQYVFGYGLGIVVLTVIVRGMMFPISRKQAMFSIKMQELAPELKKIQEKYPDDPQARLQAQQAFYRQHGINPLGSCWPVFLQMPIFLGLYFALQESIHFRLADFLWIENLAAPDMLRYWSESIPIISSPDHASGFLGALYLGPYLNVLPVVAVVFMMIQQMQTMPPPTDDQQAMQQKMLKYMSIFFGIMFYKVAAGLCIYFISSSLWGMAERKLLPKKKPPADVPTPDNTLAPQTPFESKWKGKNNKKEKEKEKDKEKEPVTTFDKLKALWREILKQAEKK